MNLINDPWIPIRRKNGKKEIIAPWQITQGKDDEEIMQLAAPRPDFNGALIQFLIGLIQTTFAPEDSKDWRTKYKQPPSAKTLQEAFKPVTHAFELDGDGPRFMQDLKLKSKDANQCSISGLLIDMPGENTLKQNKDHFIKRNTVSQLCPECAAMALYALQTNAPSGGQGHRTGLRGGGPLTTIILANNLWSTVWVNVLELNEFNQGKKGSNKKDVSERFPWLGPTRTSEKNKKTTPEDTHPDQVYWSMPRRIRLLAEKAKETMKCNICGNESSAIYKEYITKNFGVNYEGPWVHPLSPYFINKEGIPGPIHPQPGGIGYRHWLGLVQNYPDSKGQRQPAKVIEYYQRERHQRVDMKICVFGYDMDNMKARCWYESTMPLILVEKRIAKEYETNIEYAVLAARKIAGLIKYAVKKAMFRPGQEIHGDLSFVDARFWQETEKKFYMHLQQLRDTLTKKQDVIPILESWHKVMVHSSERIFDDLSQTGMFEAADPKRIALARNELRKIIYGPKIRQKLGLS